jgi:uncharacterized iron-regulated membrane protein
MNSLQRWIQAPQTHWLRRVLFQIHLWSGIGFGLYVLIIGLSGSALLLKSPFYTWFEPKYLVPPAEGVALTGEALTARMAEVYAGYELGFTIEGYEKNDATYIVLQRDGSYFPHYFNQYTGEDIGAANPWPIKSVEWLADIHDDLLMSRTGRQINGVGGVLFVLMSLSGLVLWWQGRSRWYEGLIISRGSARGLLWQLHSFFGFWALLLMLAWGVSGFQLGFPRLMDTMVAWLNGEADNFQRPALLQFFREVHFARIGEGAVVRWSWIAVSFVPTLLFVSGLIVWWRRVVRRKFRRAPANVVAREG